MTIKHHPSSESLLSCSAGSMPEAFAAVMASHIDLCPKCQADLAIMEQIGAALLENLPEQEISNNLPAAILGASETDGATATEDHTDSTEGDVPTPLQPFLGHWLDQINWKIAGPGIWRFPLAVQNESGGSVSLIKIAPGRTMPEHGHSGREMTFVIKGAFSDGNGTYGVGDVVEMDSEDEHEPVSDPLEGCICLFAVEGPLSFKSRLARLIQPLTGF